MGTLASLEDWLKTRGATVIGQWVGEDGMVMMKLRLPDGTETDVRWKPSRKVVVSAPKTGLAAARRRRHA